MIIDHVPTTSPKRSGVKMTPKYITVHSTANEKSTAKNERGWLTNPINTNTIGYHYVVDQSDTIECIPPTERAVHASSAKGNRYSIGIEMCETGDRAEVLTNTLALIRELMVRFNIKQENVVRHYDWNKKNCPRILNTDGKWTGWDEFHKRIGGHTVIKIKIKLNDKVKDVDAVNIDGHNYVKLQDIRDGQIEIGYDGIPIIRVVK